MIFLSRNTWAEKCLPGLTGQYFLQKGPSVGTGLDLSLGSAQTRITARLIIQPENFLRYPQPVCIALQNLYPSDNRRCVQRFFSFVKPKSLG
jgi:hypothetical protein